MDPITHLRVQQQADASFERSVRRGRVGQRVSRSSRVDHGVDHGDTGGTLLSLARLLHLRHA